jgi:sensor domain CHASE-containing protein
LEELLKAAVTQVPSLVVFSVVLVMVVKLFLQAQNIYQEQARSFIKQLHDEHVQARIEQRLALESNTLALRELAEAVVRVNPQTK